MEKLLKNGIFKSFLSTMLFGTIYALISVIIDGFIKVDKVLISMVFILLLCMCYISLFLN